MMPEVNCLHADDFYRYDSVTCSRGLYGGRPSVGICKNVCEHRVPDPNIGNRAPKPFKPVFARMAPALAAAAVQNMQVCAGCNQMIRFQQRHVMCNKASRCKPIPTWKQDECPLGKWKRARQRQVQTLRYRGQDKRWVSARDMVRMTGSTVFLICGGASLRDLDLHLLDGEMTMGINNSHLAYAPRMWIALDDLQDPKSALEVPEHDEIVKFVPLQRKIDAENVWRIGYAKKFEWWRFFATQHVMWGRSTMVSALRILYDLGARRVFLLGCDFKMDVGAEYAFRQGVRKGHAEANNTIYTRLQAQFELLQPVFLSLGFHVYNCNPDSRLTAFPYWGYHRAVRLAISESDQCLHGTTSLVSTDRSLSKGCSPQGSPHGPSPTAAPA
jgi:hypothetical protein